MSNEISDEDLKNEVQNFYQKLSSSQKSLTDGENGHIFGEVLNKNFRKLLEE